MRILRHHGPALMLAVLSFHAQAFDVPERIVAPAPEVGTVAPNAFGAAIAASGPWLAIGAPQEDLPGVVDAGVVYLYQWVDGTYLERVRFGAADAASGDGFGSAVAISGDTVVIGAPTDNLSAGSGAGSVYIFERNGANWEQRIKLTQPGAATADLFGSAVAISGDAIVVGSPGDDITGLGADVGSAHLFQRLGGVWTHTARLLASDAGSLVRFGQATAISGNLVVVGSRQADASAGAVYAYSFNSSSAQFEQRLVADDRQPGDEFGSALAMDGNQLLIGARSSDTAQAQDSGAAYVFAWSGTQWLQQARLESPAPQAGERFGYAVALLDGFALVGTPYAQVGGTCCEQGRARLFLGSTSAWRHLRLLSIGDAAPFDTTAFSVALAQTGVFAGAPGSNDPVSGTDATGSAVRFERSLSLFKDGFEPNP